jgi:hypothetical protein
MAKLAVQSATKSMHTLSSESHFYPLKSRGESNTTCQQSSKFDQDCATFSKSGDEEASFLEENGGAYALLLPLVLFRSACDSDCVLCGFIC